MRRSKPTDKIDFSILALDDDPIMTSTLQSYFERSGYRVDVENDPQKAVERIRAGGYDILLLDFLMTPICGDQVVREIREFNKELFIILLTGHKSMAPPIQTIRLLDIQGYFEKSDRFDQLELLVESCVKSIKQMRTIKSYQTGLSSIMDSLPQIYQLGSARQHMAQDILQELCALFSSQEAFLLLNPMDNEENGDGEPMIYLAGSLKKEEVKALLQKETPKRAVRMENLMAAPVIDSGQNAIGLLGVKLSRPSQYEQLQLLEVFSRQVSAAIGNSRLHALVNSQNEELTQAYRRLRDSYMEMVSAMRLMVDAKDIYTRGHSDRVSALAYELACVMGMEQGFCDRVRMAGLFHDVGKIGVPDSILLKPSKLTDEEYDVIKRHPAAGAQVLSAITLFHDIVPAVRSHHERLDGKGYPDGLTGEEIPIEARIIAVADSFDAMISDRQYRKGLSLDTALSELMRGKGGQFDPQVVDAFLKLLEESGKDRFLEKFGA